MNEERLKEIFLNGNYETFIRLTDNYTFISIEGELLKLLKEAMSVSIEEKEKIFFKTQEKEKLILNKNWQLILGIIYIFCKKYDEAYKILKKIDDIRFVNYWIGNIYWLKEDYQKAVEYYLKELKYGNLADIYYRLGELSVLNDVEKSKKMYKNAFILNPYKIDYLEKFVSKLSFEELEKDYEVLIEKLKEKLEPKKKAMFLFVKGVMEFIKKDFENAYKDIKKAVEIDDSDIEMRKAAIFILMKRDKLDLMEELLIKWIKKYDEVNDYLVFSEFKIERGLIKEAKEFLDKIKDRKKSVNEEVRYALILSKYYEMDGLVDKARNILEKIYKKYPHTEQIKIRLANIYESYGDVDESTKLIQDVNYENYLLKKINNAKKINLEELKDLEKLYLTENSDDKKASFEFALARAYDKLGEYEKAIEYIKKANKFIYENMVDYSIEEYEKKVKNLKKLCSYELVKAKQNNTEYKYTPIFIVGLPRSGTTMLEQIFAAHNEVEGLGELGFMPSLMSQSTIITKKNYPFSMAYMPKILYEKFAEAYIKEIVDKYSVKKKTIVDKMPHNFLHAPFILAMFKNAKIIVLRRDYRAVALSNYFQNFKEKKGLLGYSFDLIAIGKHIKDSIELMKYYKEILPEDRYQEFWYEDLVLNPKEMIPKVLEFCELDFTPEVLEFYKNKTAVKTASVLQVRNPIYTKSIEKWKNYEELLKPVIDIVGDEGIYEGLVEE